MTLTMDVILTRDVAFDNLLPTTGYVNYMETKQCDSIIQCAAVCVFCAGLLYNQNTGTCHLLKARLYETSLAGIVQISDGDFSLIIMVCILKKCNTWIFVFVVVF